MHTSVKQQHRSQVAVPFPADPYLNTDAGTMSPFEHGEVFVLDDGGEVRSLSVHFRQYNLQCPAAVLYIPIHVAVPQVDLDLGNYERFLDISLTKKHNLTTGKIYQVTSHAELSSYISSHWCQRSPA